MALYRIYYSVTWHDRKFNGSYELVSARSLSEARLITKQRVRELYCDLPAKKLSIKTSTKGFI